MDETAKAALRLQVQTVRGLPGEHDRQAWATDQTTIDAVGRALAPVSQAEVRVFIALVYAGVETETLFSSDAHDTIMRRETLRFSARLDAHLAGVSDADEFASDLRRASRFYKAWVAADRRRLHEAAREFEARATEVAAPDVADLVASIARRAFWDVIRRDLREGRHESLLNVLEEMHGSMIALLAHRPTGQDELRDRFDVNWIRQRLAHQAFDEADARNLMEYLASTIREWHASGDADVAAELVVDEAGGDFWSGTLVDFLARAHLHLGHIYSRIVAASASSA